MKFLRYFPGDEIPGFDARLIAAHSADEHLAAEDGSARCTLWWGAVPSLEGERLGVVGHFSAESPAAAAGLLAEAAITLRGRGCTMAVGPMDGNTWRRYRALCERGSEPSFFMEPDNPDWWPGAFEAAGFSPLALYSSSIVVDLAKRDPRADRARERLAQDGIRIRNLDPKNFEGDLRRIYSVSVESFTRNYLYTELPESAFLAQYLPYKEKIRPELIFLAERDGVPVGYLFAMPDYAEAARGERVRTVIGKTLAILPGRSCAGLGVVLTEALHRRAGELGFARLIHALQYEGNGVRNLTGFYGRPMRRYALYSMRL